LGIKKVRSRPVFRAHFALILVSLVVQPSMAAPSGRELLDALKRGDTMAVNRLVRSGAPVNITDEYGSSALMYAAIYLDAATMKLLLSRGADPNHADKAGATALMWSVSDAAKVRLLLAKRANVNAVSTLTGRTPLFIAAGRPGAANVVKLLLDKGADPQARDKEGGTTLTRAAFNGDPETMKQLVARRVDVNARAGYETALAIAVNRNHPGMVALLLANGADPKPRSNQPADLRYVIRQYRYVPRTDRQRRGSQSHESVCRQSHACRRS
jgi:ankyrin repeat protein